MQKSNSISFIIAVFIWEVAVSITTLKMRVWGLFVSMLYNKFATQMITNTLVLQK